MKKNSGKQSEAMFENALTRMYGKRVFIHRLQDAQALHGMNGHAVKVGKQHADYILTISGVGSFYAEVKSSLNKTSFPLSSIKSHQLAAARQIRIAGGKYYFFVHNLATDTFYMVDSAEVDRVAKTRSSLRWDDYEPWKEYESYKGK
jgi:penicillin-binding protein-related factor A (putative recombinase)